MSSFNKSLLILYTCLWFIYLCVNILFFCVKKLNFILSPLMFEIFSYRMVKENYQKPC